MATVRRSDSEIQCESRHREADIGSLGFTLYPSGFLLPILGGRQMIQRVSQSEKLFKTRNRVRCKRKAQDELETMFTRTSLAFKPHISGWARTNPDVVLSIGMHSEMRIVYGNKANLCYLKVKEGINTLGYIQTDVCPPALC